MNWRERMKTEQGAVEIVEAAFVFPVVIFVVILMILLGNLFYQQAKMDSIAVRGAEYLAAIYKDSILEKGSIPTNSTEVNVEPYRYLFGDSGAKSAARKKIDKLIDSAGTGFFTGMEVNNTMVTCEIKNYVVYQKACVEIQYAIKLFPLELFDMPALVKTSNATVTSVADGAEFIRNVDMIMDYSKEFGLNELIGDKVGAFTGK